MKKQTNLPLASFVGIDLSQKLSSANPKLQKLKGFTEFLKNNRTPLPVIPEARSKVDLDIVQCQPSMVLNTKCLLDMLNQRQLTLPDYPANCLFGIFQQNPENTLSEYLDGCILVAIGNSNWSTFDISTVGISCFIGASETGNNRHELKYFDTLTKIDNSRKYAIIAQHCR